ncbi:MAG: flagellar biosynthesis protein FlhB [Bdellovibrionales bacterium]|jgi:flagellar biosynthetic protein FlhB|nr:flagellar biosynthesis protein FlhB [Bdellovibrionales bacterium]
MADDQQEKTEEAIQQRREDFRKRGQVAQTRELASVLALLGSALLLWVLGRFLLQQVSDLITYTLGLNLVEAIRSNQFKPIVFFALTKMAFLIGPILLMLAVLSIASTVLQVGLLHNEEAMNFNLDKINPINGFKRIFSMKSVVEGIKSLLKLVLVMAVVYWLVKDEMQVLPRLSFLSVEQIMSYTGSLTVKLLAGPGTFMATIAIADYLFQRWDLEKQMRMSKQEVKEEHKSREGDPMIKARIRRIQREMSSKRMMQDIPKADVIVTNPTHIACALVYDPATMAAPQLIAKGSGAIAEKIKEIARENGVPVMENKPLARALFKTLKIGQTVPRELFTAVAQVLSYVYRLKRKVAR